MLVGDLYRCDPDSPALLLCHGMESTRRGTKQVAIARRFAPMGLNVFAFDFSYVGDSEGRFEDMTISGEVADVMGAIDFLRFQSGPLVLVGSSLGGAVAMLAASQMSHAVAAVATIAAVADTSIFTEGLSPDELDDWRERGSRRWGEGSMRSSFLDDVNHTDIPVAVAAIDCPMLVVHGGSDTVVPVEHARIIEAAAGCELRLEIFEGVGHRFAEQGALEGFLRVLEDWLVTGLGFSLRA
jgi:putative redox protein